GLAGDRRLLERDGRPDVRDRPFSQRHSPRAAHGRSGRRRAARESRRRDSGVARAVALWCAVNVRIICDSRGDQWIARAVRVDNGDPFGIECAGDSRDEAGARLTRWLDWQQEHAAALEALQQAERAYHRTIAGSAFASPVEGPSAIELQKESLEALEAARLRLDEVRARKPE